MTITYTRTLFEKDLTKLTIKLYIHKASKYEAAYLTEEDEEIKVEYTGVKSYTIVEGGKDAEEIEAHTDASGIDEYHEYLILHFENGETATYRNSHVDMFFR